MKKQLQKQVPLIHLLNMTQRLIKKKKYPKVILLFCWRIHSELGFQRYLNL